MSSSKDPASFAIISFIADPIRAERTLRSLVAQLKNFSQPVKISSIYKRENGPQMVRGKESIDKNSELVAAVKVSTELNFADLLARVSQVKVIESGSTSQALLLAMDQEILLTPGSTIPEPRLAQDRLILQCAAEVWGDYVHPILGLTLRELMKTHPLTDPIEFFSQGNYLY